MSDKELPTPDFLDIDPETQAVAAAAMNRNMVLNPPENAVVAKSKDGKKEYKRWTEPAVISNAWRESTDKGLVVAVIQGKIRTGSHNSGATVFARHMIHFASLIGQSDETTKAKYGWMNDRSVNALTTLLRATGFHPESGGLTGKLLNYMFPVKNAPGATSPLKGKAVYLNLVDSPNEGEQAKTPRQTGVETYLPDIV